MKQLTEEQIKLIEKNIDIIKTAREQHYVRNASYSDLTDLMNLYVELGYNRSSITCNTCVITFLSILGAIYESNKPKEISVDEFVYEPENNTEETKENSTTKKGRPRKNN